MTTDTIHTGRRYRAGTSTRQICRLSASAGPLQECDSGAPKGSVYTYEYYPVFHIGDVISRPRLIEVGLAPNRREDKTKIWM